MQRKAIITVITAGLLVAIAAVGAFQEFGSRNGSTATSIGTVLQSTTTSSIGTFAILMTDPPSIPLGVTALFVNFSDMQIHDNATGNLTGWGDLGAGGVINLLSLVNSTETVTRANLSVGMFDSLRFNVSSAIVTFQGQNYTANLLTVEDYLTVPIEGGVQVIGGQTSGAIVEMTPTVLLLGNATTPDFGFFPAAKGYVLPSLGISSHPQQGDRGDYNGSLRSIIRNLTHFQLTSSILNENSLNVTVQNTGSAIINYKIVALTFASNISGGWLPSSSFASVSTRSEFFAVLSNGTLRPLTFASSKPLVHLLSLAGYELAPHKSATFTYQGLITIGSLRLLQGNVPTQSVNLGQSYVLIVLGSGIYSQTMLTSGTIMNSSSTLYGTATSSSST